MRSHGKEWTLRDCQRQATSPSESTIQCAADTPSGERLDKVTNPEKTYFSGLPEGRGRKLDMVEFQSLEADTSPDRSLGSVPAAGATTPR